MKKGFTMIELVFVIVILGILASIAVPKMVATRDDATAAASVAEMKDVITQLVAYYTINGNFQPRNGREADNLNQQDISSMENTPTQAQLLPYSPTLAEVRKRAKDAPNRWSECFRIIPSDAEKTIGIIKTTNGDSLSNCKTLYNVPAVKTWLDDNIYVGGSTIYSDQNRTSKK